VAGVEGFLDVLAGDLVAAGYAVCIAGEQDAHAVPGAGSDLGGRGTGGQPQRQRGMTPVTGTQARRARRGRDAAGLVPGPAVSAFAEPAAAGAPEQAGIPAPPARRSSASEPCGANSTSRLPSSSSRANKAFSPT
jgi:hypothetical protein